MSARGAAVAGAARGVTSAGDETAVLGARSLAASGGGSAPAASATTSAAPRASSSQSFDSMVRSDDDVGVFRTSFKTSFAPTRATSTRTATSDAWAASPMSSTIALKTCSRSGQPIGAFQVRSIFPGRASAAPADEASARKAHAPSTQPNLDLDPASEEGHTLTELYVSGSKRLSFVASTDSSPLRPHIIVVVLRSGFSSKAALAFAWSLCIACGQKPARSATAEYLAGIEEAIERMQPKRMPTLIVTFDKDELEMGQCRRIAGQPFVYLHLGAIADRAGSPIEARALIAEVLAHELGHAELTCSDADHALLLPRAHRLSSDEARLHRSYVWQGAYAGEGRTE